MLCFVVLTNILLLTSLIAILSQVFTKVRALKPKLHLWHPPEGGARGFETVYHGERSLGPKE
jgi:hypothetical protein